MLTKVLNEKIYSGSFDGDCVFIPLTSEMNISHLPSTLRKCVKQVIAAEDFTGQNKESLLVLNPERSSARWSMLVGLGPEELLTADRIRKSVGTAARIALRKKFKKIALVAGETGAIDETTYQEALLEGVLLANYDFVSYKSSEKKAKSFEQVVFYSGDLSTAKFHRKRNVLLATIEACHTVRDLGSTPPGDLYPESYAAITNKLCKQHKIRCEVWNESYLKKNKFNSVLAVGQGSTRPPRVVKIEYKPKKYSKHIVLVGKGVCFDSGGLSLKDAGSMETMKDDMIGSAIVLSTIVAASKIKLPIRITGLMGLVENMPDGNSYKPGDVLRSRSGKTIEVLNTDAEGRLVLADLLDYASELKPDHIIDLATLTGAALVAVGDGCNAIMGTNQDLIDGIIKSGQQTGEYVWQLPLLEDYQELLHSPLADLKNITGTRWGGTITAGLFLKEFVRHKSWAHIDLAGCWSSRERDYRPYGASGEGPRFLIDWLLTQSK